MAPLFNNDDEKKDDAPPSALQLSGMVKSISGETKLSVGV